jgi:amino-acid racemase
MKHVGILAHSTEGAALCFLTFCQEGFRRLGRNEHRGCDAVALVCTEIPLLVTPEVSPLPTLDSTRLLARAAFDVAVGAQPMPTWRGGPAKS